MTDVESSRARELVGRTADHAPSMPEFELLVARADRELGRARPAPPRSAPRRRLIVVATLGLLLVAGSVFWRSTKDQDAKPVLSNEPEDSQPSVDTTPPEFDRPVWTADSWPSLNRVEDLELRYAIEPLSISKSTGYTGPNGSEVTIEVLPEDLVGLSPGAASTAVLVNGSPGWINVSAGDGRAPSTSLRWARDGFLFHLTVNGSPSPDEAIVMAEKVIPVSEGDLTVTVMSSAGLVGAERFDVAAASANGEVFTLQAATSTDGSAFSFWLGSGGSGTTFLLPGSFLEAVGERSSEYPGLSVYGIVDRSVASLSLLLGDGSKRPIEIESAALGNGVAFFLVIVQAPDTAIAIEAYDADRGLLETFDLPNIELPSDPPLATPLMLARLLAPVEEFVTDTLGWKLTEATIEELEPGALYLVTDSDTRSTLRVRMRSDGLGISSIAPDSSNLTVAVDITNDNVSLSIDRVDVDASSASLFVATRALEIQRTLTETQLAEGSIVVDLPGLTDETNLDFLLLFEDEAGRVISAFSPDSAPS